VQTFSGNTEEVDNVAAVVGQFSSLGFPRGYSSSGDIFVHYLRNYNPSGHVRLTFEDWNLSPYSFLVVTNYSRMVVNLHAYCELVLFFGCVCLSVSVRTKSRKMLIQN